MTWITILQTVYVIKTRFTQGGEESVLQPVSMWKIRGQVLNYGEEYRQILTTGIPS